MRFQDKMTDLDKSTENPGICGMWIGFKIRINLFKYK